MFDNLPVSALIDERILCMHGGLSPDLTKLEDIADLKKPQDIPESGLMCDLLWSDPDESIKKWAFNDNRDVSWLFSSEIVEKFC